MLNLICLLILIRFNLIASNGCEKCTCDESNISCIGVFNPIFFPNPSVSMVYMKNVHILGLDNILKSFPNLQYLILKDMRYFNCDWIEHVPKGIYTTIQQCHDLSSSTSRGENNNNNNYNYNNNNKLEDLIFNNFFECK